jgi:predicted HicB family RNase H-like nuclease
MNVMNDKGYAARAEFDAEDAILVGHIVGIRDIVGFHATDVISLQEAFREAVDDYLETCAKIGKTPRKSYSGQMMLRVDPAVRAKAALAAELAGKSLNQWSEEALAKAAADMATT